MKPQSKSQSQSSKVISAQSRFKVGSTDPSTFTHRVEFDVINELAYNRSEYTGDEQLSIYSFPSYLHTCLDKVRAHSALLADSKPGVSPTVTCCAHYGIQCLHSNEDVQALLKLKEQLDLCDDMDSWIAEELYVWFRSFLISIPDGSGTGSRKKQTIYMTDGLKKSVCHLASELGTTYSIVMTFAVMITLSIQSHIPKEHQKLLESAVDRFYQRAAWRRKSAEDLLKSWSQK